MEELSSGICYGGAAVRCAGTEEEEQNPPRHAKTEGERRTPPQLPFASQPLLVLSQKTCHSLLRPLFDYSTARSGSAPTAKFPSRSLPLAARSQLRLQRFDSRQQAAAALPHHSIEPPIVEGLDGLLLASSRSCNLHRTHQIAPSFWRGSFYFLTDEA